MTDRPLNERQRAGRAIVRPVFVRLAPCETRGDGDIRPIMVYPRPLLSLPGSPLYGAGENAPGDGEGGDDAQTGVATATRTKPKKPSQFRVLLLNDDYTPMEFVVTVLKRFFRMDMEQATRVMLHVHQKGVGVCGVYTYEVAETKVNQVMDFAKANQHPLQCTLEKA